MEGLGPGHRVADFDRGGQSFGVLHGFQPGTAGGVGQVVERRGAFGLHHGQPRQTIDQTPLFEFP